MSTMRLLIKKEDNDKFKLVKCKHYASLNNIKNSSCHFESCDLTKQQYKEYCHCSCFIVDWITYITKKDKLILYDK